MASSNPIERSFELAAGRCEDLTPLVYRRLFDAIVKASIEPLTSSLPSVRMILSPNRAHFGGSCAGTPRELFVAFLKILIRGLVLLAVLIINVYAQKLRERAEE